MKERSKRRDRSASANNRRKECQEAEEEKHLRFSLSILISCFDFHKMSIILNHASPLLLDSHA